MAEYSITMFICNNYNRYEVKYVDSSGSHRTTLIDAEDKDDAEQFLRSKESINRIERIYKFSG